MLRNAIVAALAVSLTSLNTPATAQEAEMTAPAEQTALEMRADQVVQMINGEIEPEEIFSESFLAALPPAQVKAFSASLTSQFGKALGVERLFPPDATRAALDLRFERGIARGGIAILPGEENRISELVIRTVDPVTPEEDSAEKITADLLALPGTASAWFGEISAEAPAPTISLNPDTPMALGSTFKLYVLAALARDVSEGKRKWSDVVELDAKSFPSGMMQDWPSGAPVTLHTLASLMISISDNTATDQLIKVLGRDRILEVLAETGHSAPELNDPFLTTREMFLLKGGNPEKLAAYQSGDREERLRILETIEEDAPGAAEVNAAFLRGPNALDVEWFANTGDLIALLRFLGSEENAEAKKIMAINSGLKPAVRERWDYVGYKGGSEPGVLNFTWLLSNNQGREYALILSWTNPDASLDQATLTSTGGTDTSAPSLKRQSQPPCARPPSSVSRRGN